MKKRDFLRQFAFSAILLATFIFLSVNPSAAQQTQNNDQERPNPTGDGTPPAAAGFVSGLFALQPGQSVRVAAVNMNKKAVPVEFVFVPVGEQGKAQGAIPCNAAPAPGDAMIEKFTHPGGANRILMYVQIRVQDAKDLKGIAPSLEVFNEQTNAPGGPQIFLSGADFVEIRPIWVPA